MKDDASDLPFVDLLFVDIDASPETVWASLVRAGQRSFEGGLVRAFFGALKVGPAAADGHFPAMGATLRGFRVAASRPFEELVLVGRHRYARYQLRIHLSPSQGRTRLEAETRAVFPGASGAAYRALVIGTRGHEVIVRRMLRGIQRDAEGRGPRGHA